MSSNQAKLTPQQRLIFVRNAAKKAGKIESIAKQIASRCRSILRDSEVAERYLLAAETDGNTDDLAWDADIQKSIKSVGQDTFSLYKQLAEPETFDGEFTLDEAQDLDVNEECFKIFGIKAFVDDDWVLIRLPLLWSKYRHEVRAAKKNFCTEHTPWMQQELHNELRKIRTQIPRINSYNVAFLHVIPKDAVYVADTDNYDTKHVTDVIADYFLGTDGPFICSFSSVSIREGELTPGTYVAVSPEFGNPPSIAKIISRMKALQNVDFSKE